MKKASKRRILFAARMATMVGAACFAASGISETLGQEKEKSRPVYITTEEMAETTYMPEVEETTQPTETAKAVETEEPLIASMDWDKDDSYMLCKIAMAEAESEGVKGKALVMLVVLNRVWSDEFPDTIEEVIFQKNQFSPVANGRYDAIEPDDSNTVEVVYMTTKPKTDLPTHVYIESALRPSTLLCEQISTVSEERIGEWIGELTESEVQDLDIALAVSLGMKCGPGQLDTDTLEHLNNLQAELDRTKAELREAKSGPDYKLLYDQLIEKMLSR